MNDFIIKPVEPETLYRTLLLWLPLATTVGPAAADQGEPESSLPGNHAPAPATPELPPALVGFAGLAVQRGLDILRGDMASYLKLLRQFADHHRPDAQVLRQDLAAGRRDEARQRVHALKGAAGALGAIGLEAGAVAIEQALRADDAAALVALLDALQGQQEALDAVLAQVDDAAEGDQSVGDPRRARTVLAQLEAMLACDDAATGELFAAHRVLLSTVLGAEAAKLQQQVTSFDYSGALVSLRNLMRRGPKK